MDFVRAISCLSSFMIFCSLIGYSSAVSNRTSLPVVDLGYELHQATFNETAQYYNFSNIRYAAPPLGNLRFASPAPPTGFVFSDGGSQGVTCFQVTPAWGVDTAPFLVNGTSAFNISAGYQPPNITTLPTQDPEASEDCLFLDVMVPKSIFDKAGTRAYGAPVMVWIHGGGYTLGSKTLYSPSAAGLLKASQTHGKEGVIWLAMNYRLGAFGWLSGPTFQANGTANAGLHDQRFALEWVQKNIHKFGGDPNRVTVIGESAGGGSTMHQVTAYGGLKGKVPFQQAIIQSPGYQPSPSATLQENIFNLFLSKSNVSTIQEARSLSTQQLQLANYQIIGESYPYGTFTFNPVVDGSFVPALPGKLLLQGGYDKSLNVLTGHNINEGYTFLDFFAQTEERFVADLRLLYPTITDGAVHHIADVLYPPIFNGSESYTNQTGRLNVYTTESEFTCNVDYFNRALDGNTHSYQFAVPPSLHGDDIVYTYYDGLANATAAPYPGVQNATLAVMMQEYFTNFVIKGTPNGPGLPYFSEYGTNRSVLNLNISTITTIEDPLNTERCKWWQKGLIA